MKHRLLTESVAEQLGARASDVQRVVTAFVSEIQRQLVLGEEVSVTGLGRFRLVVTKPHRRVSNLPGLKGKYLLPTAKRRLKFSQSGTAVRSISNKCLLSALVTGSTDVTVKARRIPMAKKKGKHVTVDVPREVESVTINVVDKKPKKGESSSKQRLLG